MKRVIIVVKFWRSGMWFNAGGDRPSSYVEGGIVGECPVLWFVREVVVVVGVVVSVASVVAPFICYSWNLLNGIWCCYGACGVCVCSRCG